MGYFSRLSANPLDRNSRHTIQKCFDKCRKNKELDEKSRHELTLAIGAALDAYDQWRLNPA